MKAVIISGFQKDTLSKNPDSTLYPYSFFEYELATNVTRKIGDGGLADISRDGKYVLYQRNERNHLPDLFVVALATAPEKAVKEIFGARYSFARFSWDSKNVITQDSIDLWVTPIEVGKGIRLIKPKPFFFVTVKPDDGSLLGLLFDPGTKRYTTLVKFDPVNGKLEEIAKLPSESYPGDGSISPDGRTFVFNKHESRNRIMVLDNFR
jgi:hypothetical protein